MRALSGDEPTQREVYLCEHWLWHRLAARGLTGYSEAALLVDEWIGSPPAEVMAAVERGEPHLMTWCPVLRAEPLEAHAPL